VDGTNKFNWPDAYALLPAELPVRQARTAASPTAGVAPLGPVFLLFGEVTSNGAPPKFLFELRQV